MEVTAMVDITARGLLSQVMVMLSAITTEAPRVCMDTMEVTAMVDITARGLLSQVMVMLSAITTEAPRVCTDTMEVTDMVVIMARDLLSQVIMAVPALMCTRAVLITMDHMVMVAAATNRLTGHTLPMVSVLLTLTK